MALINYVRVFCLTWCVIHAILFAFLISKSKHNFLIGYTSFRGHNVTSTKKGISLQLDTIVPDVKTDLLSHANTTISKIYDFKIFSKETNAFDLPHFQYSKDYKNPCFLSRNSRKEEEMVCLPYFFLAGFEKCGTTDLYASLTLHPQIASPLQKEPHWWGRNQYDGKEFGTSYLSNMKSAAAKIEFEKTWNNATNSWYHSMITLDATASTVLNQQAWRRFDFELMENPSNPKLSTAKQIRRLLPESKILVLVRDPVERLFSSYHFYPLLPKSIRSRANSFTALRNKNPKDFHLKVVEALKWIKNCFQAFGENHSRCIHYSSGLTIEDMFLSKIQVGFYEPILQDWFEVFPREQVKVVKLEDYSVNTLEVMNDIFSFLGLYDLTDQQLRLSKGFVLNQTKNPSKSVPMFNETKEILKRFYAPYNQKLAGLLNDTSYLIYNTGLHV